MRVWGAIGFLPLAALGIAASCATDPDRAPSLSLDAGIDAPAADEDSGNLVGNGSTDGHPCVNLECQQLDCAMHHMPDTTLTGIVYDPAGARPLYNVIVYVPNGPVEPLQSGVVCDQCGVVASGHPLVTALTGADGRFTLHNVPAGPNVPLVLQLGKWRRQITVPNIDPCTVNTMTDPGTMRLPSKQSEGDMPQIAITTGGCDAFECLLQKIGIDPSEFTNETGGGRVHVYQGAGGATLTSPTTSATTLWGSPTVYNYDLILNACECSEEPDEKPQSSINNLVDYANAGGRIFNTHYHYYWIDPSKITDAPVQAANPSWQSTASFIPEVTGTGSIEGNVDTSFPKGLAFAEWLMDVGATRADGQFPIDEARYNVVAAAPPSTQWVTDPNVAQTDTQSGALLHYTFNAPVGAPLDKQCGKVLFSDFHVVANASAGATFPAECQTADVTAQELALEFMLFDLSACIQKDTDPPQPPQTTQ
jgi:hypothetical protein